MDLWWDKSRDKLTQSKLSIAEVPLDASRALAQLAVRSMRLQCTIQDGHAWLGDDASSVLVELRVLKELGTLAGRQPRVPTPARLDPIAPSRRPLRRSSDKNPAVQRPAVQRSSLLRKEE